MKELKKDKEFYTVRGYQILNAESKLLTSSMEDYLEMIYRICIEEDYVRINQLAKKLNVRPPSATKIVQKLNRLGLVAYQRYGIVQLTKEGEEIGKFLLKRHIIIDEFLKNLGIEETRLKDTEMIEHDISLNTLESIYLLNKFLAMNPYILKKYYIFKEKFSEDMQIF
ncbi:metal-dependent transcriptional regulator [Clostridiisalibacter paucivorans]|uniref:metal-dependent transcriptional regulator n=1 Tax=Clostridiisalibacter paucivorans TaxID=408753 RepID=UPI00196AA38A|nr:iron dependent repressor, metal binding and dimerization domain protein [Clostridiisalibacter paucivorans]